MPLLMRELVDNGAVIRVEGADVTDVVPQMAELQRVGRVRPGSAWMLVWLAPDPDSIAVVDSQHGELVDP